MHDVAVGYPLGFIEKKFTVEIDNKNYAMEDEEFLLWRDLAFTKEEPLNTKHLEAMREKGLIVSAPTIQELIGKLSRLRPIRQGGGVIDVDNNYRDCIAIGKELVPFPSKSIHEIWLFANGKNSVGDIYSKVCYSSEAFIREPEKNFITDILFLLLNGLTFLY